MANKIHVNKITEAIRDMVIESNYVLSEDVKRKLNHFYQQEDWPLAQQLLEDIIENYHIAEMERVPICQDTGMVVVFLEIGQGVQLVGGNLTEAINEGVRQGYQLGFLRKSVVADPLNRENTKDNTPAVIHTEIVEGDKILLTVAPKGFGSENMSRIKMLKPAEGREGVVDFVLETVKMAGSNPCPPIIVGVGIGGTMEKAAILAKKAAIRSVDKPNSNRYYQQLEEELLEKINNLGVGPQGFGGKTTALGVNIEYYPTHIAGLPVAVNINCHVARHITKIID
ncbi:fumarate hydratase subunit alpha [Anaerobranca californiensis DSM 14826]|uniref:Fumarate hydratase subunit alpha n=1 Tax=Anaerobranca californiensis DSM 14826 TaxID=1120989 RepID=A0A1M6P7J3_9FIRM|nr:fumarate hydratase [Anaerobranca californiensis]SHK03967.1 fumarate hydratase subunit alpha [Anaerobranca californiensis DSM 14826]